MYWKFNKRNRNRLNAWTPGWRLRIVKEFFRLDTPIGAISIERSFDFGWVAAVEYSVRKNRYQGEALYGERIEIDSDLDVRRIDLPEVSLGLVGSALNPEGNKFTCAVAASGPHPNNFNLDSAARDSRQPANMSHMVFKGGGYPEYGPKNKPKLWKGHLAAPTTEEIKSGEWKSKLDARNAQA